MKVVFKVANNSVPQPTPSPDILSAVVVDGGEVRVKLVEELTTTDMSVNKYQLTDWGDNSDREGQRQERQRKHRGDKLRKRQRGWRKERQQEKLDLELLEDVARKLTDNDIVLNDNPVSSDEKGRDKKQTKNVIKHQASTGVRGGACGDRCGALSYLSYLTLVWLTAHVVRY